jgi:hypothetical protein
VTLPLGTPILVEMNIRFQSPSELGGTQFVIRAKYRR